MKRFLEEFKEFIAKGNLLAIAIGFVIGGVFGDLVKSFVNNVVMPIVAIPFGKPNFDQALVLTVNDAEIRIGAFLTTLVTFLIVAFVLFLLLKAYNTVTKGEATAPPNEVVLLREIRDELRARRGDG